MLKLFYTLDYIHPYIHLLSCLSPAAAGSAVSVKPVSDSVTQPSVSSMGTLTDSPTSLLNSSSQPSLSALGHSDDLPPSTIPPPQHNKWDAD